MCVSRRPAASGEPGKAGGISGSGRTSTLYSPGRARLSVSRRTGPPPEHANNTGAARPLLSAWLLTYTATLLELPVSQLLAPPGDMPISVGITTALSKYDYGGGTAMEVLAILSALAVVGVGYLLFKLIAPVGWRRIGRSA